MSEIQELYSEGANNTKIEEYLEESSIIQDDYKKLKHENEYFRQELHVLRLKLAASDAFGKELQEANEALEQSLTQFTKKEEEKRAKREERYRVEKEEYENCIENLETLNTENTNQITELHKKIKEYKDIIGEKLQYSTTVECSLRPYREKIEELTALLENEGKKRDYMEEQLANMEAQYQELKDILKITKEQLAEKNEVLENTREDLAANRMELESLKIIPSSDTCKGNSLFAEVEDRRQMLLDKMKGIQDKYNEAKLALKTKTNEIKLLKVQNAVVIKKWETDAIDTLQENADLLDKYKSRIFDLENKLKALMKKNNEMEEIQYTDNSFNYAQSLLVVKGKEIKELNEKIEKQAMQMLVQEEAKYNISLQLRHWQTKAMSMEAEILATQAQLETEQTKSDNNKTVLEDIENCKTISNANFEQIYDDLKVTSDNSLLEKNTCQQNSTEMLEKVDRSINKQKEFKGKVLHFAMDTKDTEKKPLKKQPKQQDYPIISITDNSLLN